MLKHFLSPTFFEKISYFSPTLLQKLLLSPFAHAGYFLSFVVICRRFSKLTVKKFFHEHYQRDKWLGSTVSPDMGPNSGLENSTCPLIFTSASGCRASENVDISSQN